MKAIFTKVYGPHRIQATDGDGNTVRVDKDPGCQLETQHDDAVCALCTKMHWTGTLAKGYVLDHGVTVGRVYVWTGSTFTDVLTVPRT